jgi:integral membrane protein
VNDPIRIRLWFRVVALAEAFSWLGLLVGMYLKYVPETTEAGVKIFGPVHGGIFIAYVLVSLLARRAFGWSLRTTAVALVSGVPPFATAVFEVLADRRGLLSAAAGRPAPRPAEPERSVAMPRR